MTSRMASARAIHTRLVLELEGVVKSIDFVAAAPATVIVPVDGEAPYPATAPTVNR